jgi:hypothetical protein
MQCEEAREQLTDYVTNSVEEPLAPALAQHLTKCEACRSETEELKALWTGLGALPTAQPSSELQVRFDSMLAAYRDGFDHARTRSWWHSANSWFGALWPRQPVLQFGFAIAFLVLGVLAGYQVRPVRSVRSVPPASGNQVNNEIANLRDELFQTRQMVALALMQQESASDRIQGVNWSYQLQKPGTEVLTALLETLMQDPNVNVRLATVDALRQFGDQPIVRRGVVDAMARQQSPMVQIALIDLAVDLHEKESIDTLRQLTEDQTINTAVRERAQQGISKLE